jgi:alcohol dehydrogenase class IV
MLHAGLGLMHAIGNVTGGLYHDLPHGLILMRCMDSVLEFNHPVVGEKFLVIEDLVDKAREITIQQFKALKVPEVRVKESDLDLLAERSIANVNALTNPRPANKDQVIQLVRDSFLIE